MYRRLLLVASIALTMTTIALAEQNESWLTRSGYYRISYRSDLEPLAINRIHSWTFHVETPDGKPVTGAVISVTGGMPLHNHGLPTDPAMTAETGDGNYVVEGFRFHMNGAWELFVTVDVDGKRDTAVLALTL
jgi:hypothetical protein